jgi:ATP-binding cassette subfamily F protein 2|tara:strand:- start:1011 stop:1586 length:576 start_codon:yes stop_codon:yes gene_type:complete
MDKPVTLEPLAAVDKKAEKEARKAAASAKREAKKGAKGDGAADAKPGSAVGGADAASTFAALALGSEGEASLTAEQERVAASRAVTGVLASGKSARDLKFVNFSLSVGGNALVNDCSLELNQSCRYGLIGNNGSGKSNVLAAIAQRDVAVPSHMSMFHLHEEESLICFFLSLTHSSHMSHPILPIHHRQHF